MSAIGLSLVTVLGIKKNIVVQACCGHLPLCSTFSRNSTISLLVSLCHTLLLSLRCTVLDIFSSPHSFCLGKASSNFFNSSFFQGSSSTFCTLSSHCQCFAHFSSSPHNDLTTSRPLLHSSVSALLLSHMVGFVILWRSPAPPSSLLIIFSNIIFHISSSCVPAIQIISAWCPLILCGSMLSHNLSQASPRPTNGFGAFYFAPSGAQA